MNLIVSWRLDVMHADIMLCRSGSGGQKLEALGGHLRVLADSLEPMKTGEPPPAASYRVHIHMEKAAKSGATAPTLSYW